MCRKKYDVKLNLLLIILVHDKKFNNQIKIRIERGFTQIERIKIRIKNTSYFDFRRGSIEIELITI